MPAPELLLSQVLDVQLDPAQPGQIDVGDVDDPHGPTSWCPACPPSAAAKPRPAQRDCPADRDLQAEGEHPVQQRRGGSRRWARTRGGEHGHQGQVRNAEPPGSERDRPGQPLDPHRGEHDRPGRRLADPTKTDPQQHSQEQDVAGHSGREPVPGVPGQLDAQPSRRDGRGAQSVLGIAARPGPSPVHPVDRAAQQGGDRFGRTFPPQNATDEQGGDRDDDEDAAEPTRRRRAGVDQHDHGQSEQSGREPTCRGPDVAHREVGAELGGAEPPGPGHRRGQPHAHRPTGRHRVGDGAACQVQTQRLPGGQAGERGPQHQGVAEQPGEPDTRCNDQPDRTHGAQQSQHGGPGRPGQRRYGGHQPHRQHHRGHGKHAMPPHVPAAA